MNQQASNEMDAMILGKTTAEEPLFSTRIDTGGGTYVRNATGITRNIDLTSVSVWNSGTDSRETATLISPRHVLLAQHYWDDAGQGDGRTFRWVTSDGTVVTRTLSSSTQVGVTDFRIGYLDSDVPSTISFSKTLSVSDLAKLITNTPLLFLDQNLNAHIGGRADTISNAINLGGNLHGDSYLKSNFASFFVEAVTGDSSHPVFVVLDGKATVLTSLEGITYGGSMANQLTGINSAMTSLGGGYQLSIFTSGYYR